MKNDVIQRSELRKAIFPRESVLNLSRTVYVFVLIEQCSSARPMSFQFIESEEVFLFRSHNCLCIMLLTHCIDAVVKLTTG